MESSADLPKGYKIQDNLAFGMRVPGLLEIKYHNPKIRNAINGASQLRMSRLINEAQDNPEVKVILVHGGLFYSSGNDISALTKNVGSNLDKDKIWMQASLGCEYQMVQNLTAIKNSNKPVVGLVRGGCIGIGFTTIAHFDFIYCTPDAHFSTPFMASCQSPEGGSTYLFAQQFGLRRANEILLLDRPVRAKEAAECGFVNQVLEGLDNNDWPDLNKIPAIPKLLQTDYKTLVNCKSLLNRAKENEKLDAVMKAEARALVDVWMDDEFPAKMAQYMMSLKQMRKRKAKL